MNNVAITPEMVKLAQRRCRVTGSDIRQEIAFNAVLESILNLDPELGLIIDEEAAFSADDKLVAAFAVSDIVVNGFRFDIRLLGDDGYVVLPSYLFGQIYLSEGSFVVSVNGDRTASVVTYVPRSDWELQDKHGAQEERILLRPHKGKFELSECFTSLSDQHKKAVPPVLPTADSSEITRFIANRHEMKMEDQRALVDAVLADKNSWQYLTSALLTYSKPALKMTLTQASLWNQALENVLAAVGPKFGKLDSDEIRKLIAAVGEQWGGQPQSPRFRQELLNRLLQAELAKSLQGEKLQAASQVAKQVMAGLPALEAMKSLVKNKVTYDLASVIKKQRQKLHNFMDATSDELAFAFGQIALQPAYATHSQDNESGLEAVNQILGCLDACELAERLKELDIELASI